MAFEICEQLGWKAPDHVIVPMASGALLCAIWRGFKEFQRLNLISDLKTRITGAQPFGCSPITNAYKDNTFHVKPIEHPSTIAKSLAIGDPGDGFYALNAIRESGGVGESVTDIEILNAIQLLAKTEGIFAEPAGGVTVAVLKKLVELGEISPDEEVVCCVTGNGFKAAETILDHIPEPFVIEPNLESLEKIIRQGDIKNE